MTQILITEQDFKEMSEELQRLLHEHLNSKFAVSTQTETQIDTMSAAQEIGRRTREEFSNSIIPIELALAVLYNLKEESVELLEKCIEGVERRELVRILQKQAQKAGQLDSKEVKGYEFYENKLNPIIGSINRRFAHRFHKSLFSNASLKLIKSRIQGVGFGPGIGNIARSMYGLDQHHRITFAIALKARAKGVDLSKSNFRLHAKEFAASKINVTLSQASYLEFLDGRGHLSVYGANPRNSKSDLLLSPIPKESDLTLQDPLIASTQAETCAIFSNKTRTGDNLFVCQTNGISNEIKRIDFENRDIRKVIEAIRFEPA